LATRPELAECGDDTALFPRRQCPHAAGCGQDDGHCPARPCADRSRNHLDRRVLEHAYGHLSRRSSRPRHRRVVDTWDASMRLLPGAVAVLLLLTLLTWLLVHAIDTGAPAH